MSRVLRRGRSVAVLAVLLVAVLAATLWPRPDDPAPVLLVTTLTAPEAIPAGTHLTVEVAAEGDGTAAVLVVSGVLGRVHEVPVVGGTGQLSLGPPVTAVAGTLTVTAVGTPPSVTAAVEVRPGPAVGLVEPLVGPRSVVVGAERVMVTAVPQDAHGNPVAAGTAVDVAVERPTGLVESWTVATDGLLAWRWVPAGLVSGSSRASVRSGAAQGPDVRFREVAGPSVPFELLAGRPAAQVDGTRSTTVRTSTLADRWGNPVTDGVEVLFDVRGPSGVTTVPAVAVGGIASASIPVTGDAGPRTVVARVGGVVSAPLTLTAEVAPEAIPLRRAAGADVDRLHVGPVVDDLGALLPDGTDVEVRSGGVVQHLQLQSGRAQALLAPGAPATVTIAGRTVSG